MRPLHGVDDEEKRRENETRAFAYQIGQFSVRAATKEDRIPHSINELYDNAIVIQRIHSQ